MSARAAGRRAGRRGGGATVNDDEFVYGRNPVRELVLAGRREASELFATEQALAGADWLSARRVIVRTRDQLARLVGTGDHQGVVARVEPYPYVDLRELLGADGPLICLDGAHDPRNLGAIARVAEGAGAAGMIIPARGGPGPSRRRG
ncbi:MAG TPA: RNA methyltransferase substrate-binding domain-containing protein, partial [Miltoncostaeaceae bacterium]|nr:RNA methyltransferase substrate-binding domain-containing protein [Miltoncostaeaceae bacterium]